MSAELAILNKAKNEAGHTVCVPEYDYDPSDEVDISRKVLGESTLNIVDEATIHNTDPFGDGSLVHKMEMNDINPTIGTAVTNNNITFVDESMFGGSSVFNGTNSTFLYDADIKPVLTNHFTISAFCKASSIINSSYIYLSGWTTQNASSLIQLHPTGIYASIIDGSGHWHNVSYIRTPPINEWISIILIYSSTGLKLYVNGDLKNEISGSFSIKNIDANVQVGGWYDNNSNYFDGLIDQVEIYNRPLEHHEVQKIYNLRSSNYYEDTTDVRKIHDIFNDSSAIATYTMDGNVKDLSGNYDGVPTNISYGKGDFYGSRSTVFNGVDSKIMIPNPDDFKIENDSVSVWFKVEHSSNAVVVFNNNTASSGGGRTINGGFLIKLVDGTIRTDHFMKDVETNTDYLGNTNTSYAGISVTPYNSNTWNNLVIVRESLNTHKIYLNGIFVNSVSTLQNMRWSSDSSRDNVSIGMLYESDTDYFPLNGEIDQLRIFNRALTESEINVLYTETLPRPQTVNNSDVFNDGSILAHYKFNGNALDETGNYNGVETNVTYDDDGKFGKCLEMPDIGNTGKINTGTITGDVISLSLWANIPIFKVSGSLFYTTSKIGIYLIDNGIAMHYNNVWSGPLNCVLPIDNLFHHYVVTSRDNLCVLYIDGIDSAQFDITGGTPLTNIEIDIGGDGTSSYCLNESLTDQLRIFNRALTPLEVLKLYEEKPEYKAVITK